jgi:hypothetical protein
VKGRLFKGIIIMKNCIECKKNPIYIKSRGLCKKCSQRYYRASKGFPTFSGYRENKIQNKAEVEFIKNFFNHKNWIFHPGCFRINGELYSPDFYDGDRNVFIEVSGTHQAFYSNRDKYQRFIKEFPKIKFEIRTEIGTLIKISLGNKGTYPINERKDRKK